MRKTGLDNGHGAEATGLNRLLSVVGLGFLQSDWHRSTSGWAVAAAALPAGWALSGYVMALFLAGMRMVPESLREAARVNGASEAQVFWHVTRPMLRPALLSAIVILVHASLKTFDLLYALDGQNLKVETPSLYMWFTTFDGGFYNRGAAIATLLLLGIALVITSGIRYERSDGDRTSIALADGAAVRRAVRGWPRCSSCRCTSSWSPHSRARPKSV